MCACCRIFLPGLPLILSARSACVWWPRARRDRGCACMRRARVRRHWNDDRHGNQFSRRDPCHSNRDGRPEAAIPQPHDGGATPGEEVRARAEGSNRWGALISNRLCTSAATRGPYSLLQAAYAVTESSAGSDVAAVQTKAERRGGGWVLNGAKVSEATGCWRNVQGTKPAPKDGTAKAVKATPAALACMLALDFSCTPPRRLLQMWISNGASGAVAEAKTAESSPLSMLHRSLSCLCRPRGRRKLVLCARTHWGPQRGARISVHGLSRRGRLAGSHAGAQGGDARTAVL